VSSSSNPKRGNFRPAQSGEFQDGLDNWVRAAKARGSASPLPGDRDARLKELERRLRTASTENDKLKRLVAEKELELAILRELRTLPNPR